MNCSRLESHAELMFDGLTGGLWSLTVSDLELEALGFSCSGISVYSVYICISQQCCLLVIIYVAPTRIFFPFQQMTWT